MYYIEDVGILRSTPAFKGRPQDASNGQYEAYKRTISGGHRGLSLL